MLGKRPIRSTILNKQFRLVEYLGDVSRMKSSYYQLIDEATGQRVAVIYEDAFAEWLKENCK